MSYETHAPLSALRYTQPVFSGEKEGWFVGHPNLLWQPIVDPWHPTYRDMLEPFEKGKFLCPRLPIDLGWQDPAPLWTVPNVLRMPIKRPGTRPVLIPREMRPILPILEKFLQYDLAVNRLFQDMHVHITVDHSVVERGLHHRFPGFHGDGFQGAKFPEGHKKVCEHSYILCSAPGTELCMQPFFVRHLDDAKHNVFYEFDDQARRENILSLRPDHMYLFDPYVVHRSPRMEIGRGRVFFRMTITPEELLVPENTKSPCFDGQDYEPKVDVRKVVSRQADLPIPWEQYGLQRRS